MELKEQAGIDFRDEFDRMNTALLIKEEYDTLIQAKGPDKEDEVLNIIASKIPGKDKKHVKDYLKFLEFVDLVLEALDREKEHHRINTKTDNEADSKPVTTVCIEYQRKWEKALPGKPKTDIIFHCAAFCQGVFNESKDTSKSGDYRFNSRSKRNLSSALNKKSAKAVMDNYDMSNFDFQSKEDIKNYGDMLQLVEQQAKDESWLERPGKLLNSIESSLRVIDESLSTSESKKIKAKLEHVHVKRSLKLYGEIIDRIDQKIKTIKG
jgi:RNA polymerase-binding transcription factor DksA